MMRRNFRRSMRVFTGVALASALCVPAAAAQFDYFIKLPPIEGDTSADKHKDQIEILSYSWGATQTGSFGHGGGGGAGKVSMQDISAPSATSGGSKAKGEKGGTEDINIGVGELQEGAASKDMTLKGSKIGENSTAPAGGVRVAVGDVDGDGRADVISPRDAASGQATGKRMHKPVYFPAPRDRGSLTVRGKFPGCAVGTRYPSLELGGRAARYQLTDVIVTRCATVSSAGESLPMEEVSFNYAKIQF